MMHTEESAKKLWCPMARVYADKNNFYYDTRAEFTVNPTTTCLASSCMMWRWVTTLDGDKGYCGLAGVPK